MRFDPYREWLDLPEGPRPPHPYALLGLPRFERDRDRIVEAAAVRERQVRHQASFDRVAESQQLLREIHAARDVLLNPERRRRFEMKLRRAEKPAGPAAPPVAVTTTVAEAPPPHVSRPLVAGLATAGLATTLVLGVFWFAGTAGDDAALPAKVVATEEAPATAPADQAILAAPEPDVAAPRPAAVVAAPAERSSAIADRRPVMAVKPAESAHQVAQEVPAPQAAELQTPVEADRPVLRSLAAYRLPSFAAEQDAAAYVEHLRALLDEGLASQNGVAAAQRHHRELRRLATDTALADYALGLVFWKRLRLDEAATQFTAARDGQTGPFLPAWQAVIQLHLKRNQREAALQEAVAFAAVLGAMPSGPTTDEARDELLRWLGRLTAALEAPWQADDVPPQDVLDAEAAIREHLGDALVGAYKDGRRSMRDDLAVQTESVEATIAARVAAHDEQQAEDLDAIASERDEANERRVTVSRSVEELQDRLDEQTFAIDSQLTTLRPQLQQLTTQVNAARTTLALINEQIALELEVPREDRPPIATLSSNRLLAAREQALVQFRLVARQAADVQQQAESLANRRRALVAEFEQATSDLAAERNALTKRDGILMKRAEKARASEAEATPAVRSLRRRLHEVGTYVPFDIEAETQTVFRALEQSRRSAHDSERRPSEPRPSGSG